MGRVTNEQLEEYILDHPYSYDDDLDDDELEIDNAFYGGDSRKAPFTQSRLAELLNDYREQLQINDCLTDDSKNDDLVRFFLARVFGYDLEIRNEDGTISFAVEHYDNDYAKKHKLTIQKGYKPVP